MIRFEEARGKTVCICTASCASTQVEKVVRQLALAGASVIAPPPAAAGLSPMQRASLAASHLRAMEDADLAVVANIGGHTGPGTASEIAYARRLGLLVVFAEDPVEVEIDPDGYARLVSRDTCLEIRPTDAFPADLAAGSILALRAPGTPGEYVSWFRTATVTRFPSRAAAMAGVDRELLRPDGGRSGLLARLGARYPAARASEHLALEVEFIAELPDAAVRGPRAREFGEVALVLRDQDGQVLLAGGGGLGGPARLVGDRIEAGEYPASAARRLRQRLVSAEGPVPEPSLLALEHQGPAGERGLVALYVFDGGVVDQEFVGGRDVGGQAYWAAPQEIAHVAAPRTARVIAAALARVGRDGAVLLEHGYGPGLRPEWEWCASVPAGLPVTQSGVWAVARDGRVVVQHRVAEHRFALPAGRPEPGDADLLATAAREALEESQIVIDVRRAVLIGYQVTYSDPGFPDGLAQARYVAPILQYRPIAPDADPALAGARHPHRRLLVDVRRAAGLLDWGPHGEIQTRLVERAALEMGLPVDRPSADGYRDHGDTVAHGALGERAGVREAVA